LLAVRLSLRGRTTVLAAVWLVFYGFYFALMPN
jgi:hypothetical protein